MPPPPPGRAVREANPRREATAADAAAAAARRLAWMNIDVVRAAMRSRRILDDGQEPAGAVAAAICKISSTGEVADAMVDGVASRRLMPGTPMLLAGRRAAAPVAACTVAPLPPAPRGGAALFDHFRRIDSAQGIGVDLSECADPAGTYRALNDAFVRLDAVSERPVAGMATLDWDHPRAAEFMRAKWRSSLDPAANKFNISMWMDAGRFAAQARGEQFGLLLDMMLHNGEPGVLFRDRYEAANPDPERPYASTAPCAELAMADDGDACHFVALNLHAHLTAPRPGRPPALDAGAVRASVRAAVRFLDDAVEHSLRAGAGPGVARRRRVGVNVCGVADALAAVGLAYGDAAAVEWVEDAFAVVNVAAKLASTELAKERGAFPAFPRSRLCTDRDWALRQRTDRAGLGGDWDEYALQLAQHGQRNASVTSAAPTGASARFLLTSQSLEPRFAWNDPESPASPHPLLRSALTEYPPPVARDVEREAAAAGWRVGGLAASGLAERHAQLFPTATELDSAAHIAVVAAAQRHLDDAVSKTINLRPGCTRGELSDTLHAAHAAGLKGVTVFPAEWRPPA